MMDRLSKKIRQDVETSGRSVVAVARDRDGPGYADTVGLFERFAHPELIVVGVPRDVGYWLLEELSARIQGGLQFQENQRYGGILKPPYRLAFRRVHPLNVPEYLRAALRYYQHAFPAAQVFLPDESDRVAWEESYRPKVPSDVRLLYLRNAQ